METVEGTHAYELNAQPVHNLSQRLIGEVFVLVRSEVELAMLEIESKAQAGLAAGKDLGLAAALTVAALVSLGVAVGAALALAMPVWLAALIVAVLYAVPALVLSRRAGTTLAATGSFIPERALAGLWGEVSYSPSTTDEAAERAQSAAQNLDRTMGSLTQRIGSRSPVRDAVVSGIGITIGSIFQARKSNR
jgi:uncharacterized membrane protein YqjE